MESGRRVKRKSPSKNIIFEVSDADISPEPSDNECSEPEAKVLKIDCDFHLISSDDSNLESDNPNTSPENSPSPNSENGDNSFIIVDSNSLSNHSTVEVHSNTNDIIDITADDTSAPNEEEIDIGSLKENDNSLDVEIIVDVTEQAPSPLKEDCEISPTKEEILQDNGSSLREDNSCGNSTDLKEEICYLKTNESSDDIEVIDITELNSSPLREDSVDIAQEDNLQNNLKAHDEDIPQDIPKVIQSPLREDDLTLEEGELNEIANCVEQIDSNSSSKQPCICINFSDQTVAEQYKSKFLKYIQSFVELQVENFDGLSINIQRDPTLNPNDWVVIDDTICLSEVKELNEENVVPGLSSDLSSDKSPGKKKRKRKNKKEKELFVVDTNPSSNENNISCTKYSTKFQIDKEESSPETAKLEMKISTQICFNCDDNHAIRDCPLPKNYAKINAARQRFKAQKQTSRYHLEEDQKYGHFTPGKMSDKLREALGLRRNELPPYIYQMRLLGYPPGWLEEAKIIYSNLEMFDSDGKNVRGSLAKRKEGLDPEKVKEYPGFNVPMPKHVKDEYRLHRVPPYSTDFSKEAMINYFEKECVREQDNFETCDMDLDKSFEERKQKSEEIKEKIANPLLNEIKEMDSNIPSPSLTDLEKEKENLLAALEENSSCNSKSVEIASEEHEKSDSDVISDAEKAHADKTLVTDTLKVDIDKAQDADSAPFSSPPLRTSVHSIKDSAFGTPILKSSSPYSHLPNPDNFMKDVSPVINFENLPNSTGKYEQMTEVLQKVRNTMRKNLQNCSS
ncbi:hypothetical protein NQ317_013050 [Molorchus minor]|uniref:PSP proline-rich domain-containing protein n=1 Tax=Molorchus minor TaxID=1323400 RepID=A0ABQ9K4Q9_9CUCU|nr:hypothetical protein NQ317_013050 [Molorchus minor]